MRSTAARVAELTSHAPAPGHYQVNDKLVYEHASQSSHAVFKSRSERQYLANPTAEKVPGPGSYEPYNAPKATRPNLSQRLHRLPISAPPIPLPPAEPSPGPGHYDLASERGSGRKRHAASSMFLSQSARSSFGGAAHTPLPGPAHYRPNAGGGRHSYNYNAESKWI